MRDRQSNHTLNLRLTYDKTAGFVVVTDSAETLCGLSPTQVNNDSWSLVFNEAPRWTQDAVSKFHSEAIECAQCLLLRNLALMYNLVAFKCAYIACLKHHQGHETQLMSDETLKRWRTLPGMEYAINRAAESRDFKTKLSLRWVVEHLLRITETQLHVG